MARFRLFVETVFSIVRFRIICIDSNQMYSLIPAM